MTFSEKIKQSRKLAHLTQQQLADTIGVSQRAIAAYETQGAKARKSTIKKLALALNVSEEFLANDDCINPLGYLDENSYCAQIRKLYGSRGIRDMQELLSDNAALFAGGELTQEQKDEFFRAVMTAYIMCREEARKKYSPKKD